MPVFRPSRAYRRQFAGKPCPACGNRVDANDLVAFAPGGQTFYLHESCVQVALEMTAAVAQPGEEEDPGATAAGSHSTMMSTEPEEA